MEIIGLAFLTALAFFIIMTKIGIRKFLKYHWQSDVLISGILTFLFVGTFTGMTVGLIAGIFISFFLSIAKRIVE